MTASEIRKTLNIKPQCGAMRTDEGLMNLFSACNRTYTPHIPMLDAASVLDILAAHEPALYNQVMQVASRFCHSSLRMIHEQYDDNKHGHSDGGSIAKYDSPSVRSSTPL